MADYDYEKIFKDMEEEDNARRATSAITPEGGIPTVNFDGTPATAKAVIASPEPQKNLNEWDRLNSLERAWHAFWGGGVRSWLKSNAVSDITEKKQAADAGLSALFGSDDMDLDDASMEKFRQAYADKTVGGKYKKQKERELEEAIGDYIDLSKKDKDYYAPTVVSAASKATEGKGFWESIPAWFAEVSKDPFDYALYIAGSSAGAIAPFLATSMAGGFALNAFKLNAVARAVQAATMGAGSYNVEFGSYIENYIAEKGYDLSNVESIKEALGKEDVNAIREKAFRRAAVVGAFDAISAWIAPIRLNPSNALRTLRRGVAEGVQDVALPASRLHRVGKGLENMTLQTTLQGVMGGAGEAFGQLVNGEKINWGEVFAEAIGEFTTAPVEVVGLAYSANANFNRETTIARNAQEINKNLQDISNVVTAVAAKLPDNGSLQQWCEAVGKDKTLFAFAQDVIDSGAIDKLKEVAPALAQQVIEAAEKKSDVNVPVSDILKLSATDEATARKLLNDVRLTADGMSPNQAEKFLKEGKKGIVEKFQKIVDDAKPDIELRKAIKVETDKIANELVSTGTTKDVADLQVLPWASWLAVRAKQTGMKPSEIMEKVRLRIQGEQSGSTGALNRTVESGSVRATEASSAAEKLKVEVADWKNRITALKGKPRQPVLMLKQTPVAMHLVGADFLELRASPHFFDGMFPNAGKSNPNHHIHMEMDADLIAQVPEALTDPVAITRDERNNSYIFVLDLKNKEGNSVVVPVRFSATGPHNARINLVKTAFGRDSTNWLELQGNNNALRYVNREKLKRLEEKPGAISHRAPNASIPEVSKFANSDGTTVLTEVDLVKAKEKIQAETGQSVYQAGLFQRGYIGRSESVRASEARQEGQKPLSKWTKKAIIEAMKANGAPEELLRKAEAQPLWVLQQSVLSKASWHHTGPNYQKTDFYGINDDYSDEKLGASWVSERIDEAAKAYSADYTEEAKKFAEFALSDFLAFDYYKEHQLGIFKKDRDFKRYTAYQKALESVEEEAHKRAEEFHKRRDTQSSRPLTQRDVARALEQLGYHGSPYQFDRFTLSHIGSGEGAQAHGWGLYFALSRRTAEGYRKRLAGARTYTYNGKSLDELYNELKREFQAQLTEPSSFDKFEKLSLLTSKMLLLTSFTIGGKAAVKFEKNDPKSYQDAYKWLTEEVYPNLKLEKKGRVYTVEIPDDDVMLREEWKISKQNDAVKEAYRQYCKERFGYDNADVTSPYQNGYDFYSSLSQWKGSPKEASLWLNKHGVKGIRYKGARDGECAVVWDEQSIKILNALEQGMQSGPRGMYMPQNTSDTNSMSGVMTLMQTRDKSTFLHESAHVWLDADTMLAKNIAEKVKSGQEITDGEKAFLKNLGGFFRWGQSEGVIDLGVTDDISTVADAVIRWSQMTTNDQRMMHELFAEGFESYLMSGTAPNPEMRTVFGRFKKWLMDIYARATKQPRPISREVRKLYDLMFATQQQAQDTETRLGLQAMFKAADAKKLGMTDAEVQAYEELQEQATLETEGLVAKMVRGTMRIFGRARQDEIARIEKDKEAIAKKEAELLEEPRYRAVAMLNARQTVLDIRQMQGYDTDTIDALDAKGWISHDGGVSPDVLASMAGTTDAVGLIGDILDIDTVGDAHDEALRILAFEERKEFGDEGVFDELRANLAAYNDTRSRLLTAEYNAIARMLGNQQILRSAAREYAIEQIGNTKMSDLHPYTFVQAEQRCAREAEEALRKGDYAACLEAKRGQVLNHELARAALEAQERMDKGIRAVRRAMKSKTIHPQYKQLIAALVNAHAISNMTKAEREEFAKVEGMPPEKVTEFLAKLEENGTPVDGVAEFLQTHEHVQDMTAYTAEDFFGVVKQVATLGRNVLNQSLTEIAESVKEVVALGKEKLNEAADVQGRKVLKNQRSPMTRKERALNSVAQFLLGNVKIQSWCRIFDRNKDGGFFWNLFIRSANEHANFEAEQRARCSQVLREKLLPAFKKSQDEDPIVIPGFDRPFTHGMRIAVALNMGNESNKQRLITNDPRFTTEALQAIMDSLTEADWRAVEAVWQLFESFKTAIGEKEMRVYGVEPEWIKYEPFKVKTKEGKTITVSGGYYPVKYDPVASNKVDKRTDAEATEQDLRGAYQSATTRRSFTQSRVTGDVTDMPLRLDLTALYEGLNDVIHDLAWHEWLIDTKRVLDGAGGPDSGLRAAIKERYGYNVAKEFEEWRKDIALGGRSEGSSEALSFFLRNVGMATMGYSLTSAAVQLTGVGYVIPRTGVKAFTVALGKYLTSPLKTRRFVNSQSQAMLLRAQTQFKELAQIRNRLDQGKGFRAWMVDHAYSMMTFMQGIVDSVCWQAAYEKFSRQGYEGKELTALCDQTVIDTQSSGNISDLSRIERDKRGLARMMTMFYSWMNAALNMVVTTGMSEENKAKKIASLFWMCAVMPLIEQTFRDSLAAKGDDDDDDDDELAWMREDLGTIVEFNLGLLPVTREFSTAAESFVKGEPVFDYRGPAGLRLLSNVTGGIKTLANPDERKITRAITDLGGSLLGLPSVQINRTVKGVRAINSGQAEGFDAIKAPLFGFKGKIDD